MTIRYLGNSFFPYRAAPKGDLSDIEVERPKPWLAELSEPLLTDAPGPPVASPYCCYLDTVLFQYQPLEVDAAHGGFREWDRVRSRLRIDDLIELKGEVFQIQGGRVQWRGRWVMLWNARLDTRQTFEALKARLAEDVF